MPEEATGRRRFRTRLRGAMSSRSGRAVGLASIASLAAPVVGFIINDLKQPDSVLKAIARRTVSGLLTGHTPRRQAVDITDKVQVTRKE